MHLAKPYQITGSRFLADAKRAYLADEMRLGKSVQTVIALSLAGAYDSGKMNLIVAPASAVYDWPLAFRNWSPENPKVTYVNLADIAKGRFDFRKHHYDVVVMSYECMKGSIEWLLQFEYDTIILDEAHYLKSADTLRTKAVFGRPKKRSDPAVDGLLHRCQRAWYLSGTPMPNHPGELWSVLYHNWPEAIINAKTGNPMNEFEFERRFVKKVSIGQFDKIVGGKNLPDLRERIAPFFLRRTKAQVRPEMDPITYQMLPVQIREPDPDLKIDEEALKNALAACSSDEQRLAVIQKAEAFQHYRSHLAVFKALEVSRRVGDECYVDPTLKQVVMGWHTDGLKLIHRHLLETGMKPAYVDGSVSPEKRGEEARRFREDPKCRVFVGQIKAAGVGVDGAVADILTFNDMSWVPGDNVQAAARIESIVNDNAKTVRIAYAEGTADEDVGNVLLRKLKDSMALFDAGAESQLAGALAG